ncbi:sigma-70 family RNA polymerase sigma factor [Methylophaga sp. SB9B]|uniref:sigma-70 family RNA polymerase sigma factor n=1 Tax=Methylophaga sp. SB9B TaxID=2570356 RepID=UPI0010A7C2F7|nr:sigma-70 family RNA polymerase sigma factor [Methylophaga sp. SB9B]
MSNTAIYQDLGAYTVNTPHQTRDSLVTDLYQKHNSWLMGWLSRKLGCSFDAADLMQDTFSRILQKDDLTDIKEPRAYLTTIAHGLMVNHVRRRDIEAAYLEEISNLPQAEAPSPETIAIMIETLTKIDQMLDGLPSKTRNAFLWFQLEGLSHAQIAERLSVSVSSVRQYIAKALLHCITMTS